jgi:Predicted membrane protein
MNIALTKNDKKARTIIFVFSAIVFIAVSALGKYKLNVNLGFDEHIFAKINAVINSIVSCLLLAGLYTARNRYLSIHKNIMLVAMALSILFLISYICHHLFAGEARFGDLNHDGILSADEKIQAGSIRYFYYVLLSVHILLAGIVLPFILFTAYRALVNENEAHRKLAKITWPIWFFVAVSGPVVYFMISKYY